MTEDYLETLFANLDVAFVAKTFGLLETHWGLNKKHNWTLFSFSPFENYKGAISVKGNYKIGKPMITFKISI